MVTLALVYSPHCHLATLQSDMLFRQDGGDRQPLVLDALAYLASDYPGTRVVVRRGTHGLHLA